jgi:formiminotetrahydrofolate cyclodeaminase
MRVATEVPLETMQACAEVLGLGKVVAELGNRSAASDVGVGMHLAMTGLTGARFNVEINLSGSSDGAFLARVRKDVLLMMVGGGADLQAALRAVELRSQA